MKVKELIEKLQKYNPEATVYVSGQVFDSDEGYVGVESDVKKVFKAKWREVVEIEFEKIM